MAIGGVTIVPVGGSSGMTPDQKPTNYICNNLTDREALILSPSAKGSTVLVKDASDDETVDSGWAFYSWDGESWTKTAEGESMEVAMLLANYYKKTEIDDLIAEAVNEFDKGYYATEAALNTSLPVGEAGWKATVGETDTIWIWDTDTTAWINSGKNTSIIENGGLQVVNDELGVKVDALTITIDGTGKLAANAGTGANQLVKLDDNGKLPAVDGSSLTNLPAGGKLIAKDAGYVADNGSTQRGTIGTKTVDLSYTDNASFPGGTSNYSFCAGYNVTVTDEYGICIGANAISSKRSVVLGYQAKHYNDYYSRYSGVVIGDYCEADTLYSVVIGYSAKGNDGSTCISIGRYAECTGSGENKIAIGKFAYVGEGCSNGIAIGYYAHCDNPGIAIGNSAKVSADYSTAIGILNASTTWIKGQYMFGTSDNNGNYSFLTGQYNYTDGATVKDFYWGWQGTRLPFRAGSYGGASWTFEMLVTGISEAGGAVGYKFIGVAHIFSGTYTLDYIDKTVLYEYDAACDANVVMDSSGLGLQINGVSTRIQWNAVINFIEHKV